jgi:hypothetical protein
MQGNRNYLKDRHENYLEGLKKSKNANVLEYFPAKIYPGVGENRIRIRRKPTVRKFNFESKN